MDNETLIKLVRECKFLYDLSDKKYGDNQKKDQTWEEIGLKLRRNGNECKKAWALLRDAFRRAIKKRKDIENGQMPEKKWKYEEEMSFLLPYMKERSSQISMTSQPNCDLDKAVKEEAFVSEDIPHSIHVVQQAASTLSSSSLPSTPPAYPPLKRKKRAEETHGTILVKYIIDGKKNIPSDDVGQFMAGITTTMRSFPPRDRALVKAKIFEIVSNMEIELLSRPSTSDSMVSTPSSHNSNYAENITVIPDTLQDVYQEKYSPDSEEHTHYGQFE